MSTVYRVALLLPMNIGYGRGVMQGVGQFVSDLNQGKHESVSQDVRWRIHRSLPSMDVLPLMRKWQPEGVIAHIDSPELAKRLARLKVPVVNTTSTIPGWEGPLVEVDHEQIGNLAAEHFLQRAFRSFGYIGSDWAGFSLSREAAFRSAIASAGYEVSSCHLNYLPLPPVDQRWDYVDTQLIAWLKTMKKPAAIFASNDRPAREVIDACATLGISVPRDVAVLGVDDDEYECFLGSPTLSSIVNPSEKIGRVAAKMLHQLMQGEPTKSTANNDLRVSVSPPRVSVRQSSDTYHVDDPHLRSALELIRDGAVRGLTPAEVHQQIGCSRRLLERRFQEVLGRSMVQEIRRVRLERAKLLLIETTHSIEQIARMSGFSESRLMSTAFKSEFNITPSQYRKEG
ncbi:MAG: XylR family transcriptional regulator [Planctomycetota bacterium]